VRVHIGLGDGFNAIIADLQRLGDVGISIAKKRFAAAGPQIVARQKAMAPVDVQDGGQMRDSIRFTAPRAGAKSFASMSFTVGGDVLLPYLQGRIYNVYAIVQETDPTLHHDGGQAGFMTQPVAQAAPAIFDGIAKDIDAEVASASG